MRPKRLTISALALLGSAALVLSGCASAQSGEGKDSPLEPYFSAVWGEDESTQEQIDAEAALEQDTIAACMTKEGFEYIPDLSQTVTAETPSTEEENSGPEWGTVDFAKQYGYGIISWPGDDEVKEEEVEEEYIDPNEEYVESLSDADRMAYSDALWGPSPTDEEWAQMETDENYEFAIEDQGCWGGAQAGVSEDSVEDLWEDPEFTDLMENLDTLWTATEEDERIINLRAGWAECMAEAGYAEFSDRGETENSLHSEWNAVTDELNINTPDDGEWKEPTQDQKDTFQKREIEIAVADATCAKKIKWDKTLEDVHHEYEQKFVENNQAQLDAMVAKYGVQK